MRNNQELQSQWATGRDLWFRIPQGGPRLLETTTVAELALFDTCCWPSAVTNSHVLYGLGAYNPRGQVVADDINQRQHALMRTDLNNQLVSSEQSISTSSDDSNTADVIGGEVLIWDAMSLWEDGTSESGFIVAFLPPMDTCSTTSLTTASREKMVSLATRYEQGAIYEFCYQKDTGSLIRSTLPVLNPDTEASVEVFIRKYEE